MNPARGAAADWCDGLAAAASIACLVHCLVLPVAIALLPAWSAWLDAPEWVHLAMLGFAVPVSGLTLWSAARRHARTRPAFLLGLAGLALMAGAILAEGGPVEAALTSLGAISVAFAHLANWRSRSRRAMTRWI